MRGSNTFATDSTINILNKYSLLPSSDRLGIYVSTGVNLLFDHSYKQSAFFRRPKGGREGRLMCENGGTKSTL